MSSVALIAAQEWARVNARDFSDPVEFGNKVGLVYVACEKRRLQGEAPDAPQQSDLTATECEAVAAFARLASTRPEAFAALSAFLPALSPSPEAPCSGSPSLARSGGKPECPRP